MKCTLMCRWRGGPAKIIARYPGRDREMEVIEEQKACASDQDPSSIVITKRSRDDALEETNAGDGEIVKGMSKSQIKRAKKRAEKQAQLERAALKVAVVLYERNDDYIRHDLIVTRAE